ncbi:hypothetical protein PACTADRAFT_86979 [Pachysolen tannophilus NRRL Y-2460]|uniref:RFX-type winged-helix domain-containing protein n=1 Tax=Pachysolen tannophilus NRRL Y-2460 TaxID=669874 RepID=A0A1E4TQC2_PACTA|nr:hypothetical protein PACTADRAFT_86979 [Pachysolen tannophilus NRRL Y-2460]
MSYGSNRPMRPRIYNYTVNSFQSQYQTPSRQSHSYPSQHHQPQYYQPSQAQLEEESTAVIPKPIVVPSLQEQDQIFLNVSNVYQQSQQFNYRGVLGVGKQGAGVRKRVEMGFQSGLKDEVSYSLNTIVEFSHTNPQLFNLKENPFVLFNLVKYLDCSVIEYLSDSTIKAENDNLNFSLDAAIALRNLSQIIDNAAIMSLDPRLKEILVKIMTNGDRISGNVIDDNREAIKELLRYTVDIVETISSYIAPAPIDDPLFISLIGFLQKTNDRYLIISLLRSLSRLMVRSVSNKPSAADNISSKLLDQITSYLLLSTTSLTAIHDLGYDELILATLDFLYQYSLPGGSRISKLIESDQRSLLLKTVLLNLLTYNLTNIQTEYKDRLRGKKFLKLIKRIKPPVPISPPFLKGNLYNEIYKLDEPQRATTWMRCCYQSVENGEVTQISLWKSYESQFTTIVNPSFEQPLKKLLPAVDFIKNVCNAFPHSSAKVINLPDGSRKFIIKGIQPRQLPVSIEVGNKESAEKTSTGDGDDAGNVTDEEDAEEEDNLKGDSISAQQKFFKILNYGANNNIKLNEINSSSALLLNCLAKDEAGCELLKGYKSEILDKVLMVPPLFNHVFDSLDYLDY